MNVVDRDKHTSIFPRGIKYKFAAKAMYQYFKTFYSCNYTLLYSV